MGGGEVAEKGGVRMGGKSAMVVRGIYTPVTKYNYYSANI